MTRRTGLAGLAAVAVIGVALGQDRVQGQDQAPGQGQPLRVREHMTAAEWQATGLQRLSEDERAALGAWLTRFAAAVRRGEVADPSGPPAAPPRVTLERANLDPAKWSGQSLVFEGCAVGRPVTNVPLQTGKVLHGLSIRSAAGTAYPTLQLSEASLNVLVGDRLASAITDLELGETRLFQARLTCTIGSLADGGHTYWTAQVTQVDVCAADGRVLRTLKE